LVLSDPWERALLRAELRERGYEALALPVPAAHDDAKLLAWELVSGHAHLIVVDDDSLPHEGLAAIAAPGHRPAPGLLLTHAGRHVPEGPWLRVLHRPFRIGDIADTVERLAPLPMGAPLDD
jgi:hypothetical protein